MKTIYVLILAVLVASSSIAEENNILVSSESNYSIQPPIAKNVTSYPYTMAVFYLPNSDGFSPNVNIQKQFFKQSIEDYDKITLNQFKRLNAVMVRHKIQENNVLYECKATLNNRNLHFFSRAIKKGNFVYLITATSLESQWEKHKSELLKSANSFKLIK